MDRGAWRDFFITVFLLGIAFVIALLSSIAAQQNMTRLAAVAAAISLLLAVIGAIYIVFLLSCIVFFFKQKTAYEIGMPRTLPPSCMSHNGLPLSASSAKKLPSWLPPKTRPPAVESRLVNPGERSGNSHFIFPVVASSARIAADASSPLTARPPPPVNAVPGLYSASPL